MKKRLFVLALSVLCTVIFSTASSADDVFRTAEIIQTEKALVYTDDKIGDTVVKTYKIVPTISESINEYETENTYFSSEEAEKITKTSNSTLLGELEQLSTPTDLKWNIDNLGNTKKGWVSWNTVENCEGTYDVILYCNGEVKLECRYRGWYDYDGNGKVSVELKDHSVFDESGKYTFSVQAIGDNVKYADSEIAVSGEYDFACPDQRLEAPSDLQWLEDGVLRHSAVENADGYSYELYNQERIHVGSLTSSSQSVNGYIDEDLSWYMKDVSGWEENLQGIYVKVCAITSDIEVYQNSEYSQFSEFYSFVSPGTVIENTLDTIMEELDNGNISASEALDSFLQNMEDSNVSNTDFAVSIQQNEALIDTISKLETKFCEETATDVSVRDSSEDENYLENRGIDVNKISVVGAALNSKSGENVNINFSEADDSLSVDELFYKNSVSVNIGIDGVKNDKKLDVPIQIKMPVPKGVLPERLVILHYHADGTIETIHPTVTYIDGEAYVSFVLTSFSPFVFCNEITIGDINGDNTLNRMDLLRLAKYFAGWNVEINEAAADVTGDGVVSRSDLLRLAKYFAGHSVNLGE